MTTSAAATSSQILHHTATFVSEALSQAEVRRRLLSVLRHKLPSSLDQTTLTKPLNLVAQTLENAISTASPSVRSSSLRAIESLLLSHPENSVSSLLLSLTYGLWRRPIDAARSLLDVFRLEPSSARSEIAPSLFEELFLIHLLPVLGQFNERRTKILANSRPNMADCDEDYSICEELAAKSLSKMSDEQASELKWLEMEYEEVLDENCRVLAKYLKEVLENEDENENRLNSPTLTVMETRRGEEADQTFDEFDGINEERPMRSEELVGISINGRYNVMF